MRLNSNSERGWVSNDFATRTVELSFSSHGLLKMHINFRNMRHPPAWHRKKFDMSKSSVLFYFTSDFNFQLIHNKADFLIPAEKMVKIGQFCLRFLGSICKKMFINQKKSENVKKMFQNGFQFCKNWVKYIGQKRLIYYSVL